MSHAANQLVGTRPFHPVFAGMSARTVQKKRYGSQRCRQKWKTYLVVVNVFVLRQKCSGGPCKCVDGVSEYRRPFMSRCRSVELYQWISHGKPQQTSTARWTMRQTLPLSLRQAMHSRKRPNAWSDLQLCVRKRQRHKQDEVSSIYTLADKQRNVRSNWLAEARKALFPKIFALQDFKSVLSLDSGKRLSTVSFDAPQQTKKSVSKYRVFQHHTAANEDTLFFAVCTDTHTACELLQINDRCGTHFDISLTDIYWGHSGCLQNSGTNKDGNTAWGRKSERPEGSS